MIDPGRIDDALRNDLCACFSVAQRVELTLDVVAWNKQKVPVALDADRAVAEQSLTPLTFDADGHTHIGKGR